MASAKEEDPAALFARLFSFYRESYPVVAAKFLPLCIVGGFEKCFGVGRIVCIFCGFASDCRLLPDQLDNAHYASSPGCQLRRLTAGPLEDILVRLQTWFCAATFSEQFYFEDELLRQCSVDADFRLLTFAYGQWRSTRAPSSEQLARHGLYFSIKKHCVRCVACLRTLDNPQTEQNLTAWHAATSPKCRFVQQALTGSWEQLRYTHDRSGFLCDGEVEVVNQPFLPPASSSRLPFPATAMRTVVPHRDYPPAKRARPLKSSPPASSLATLFGALNSSGISDFEARKAISTHPTLIQARSTAQFLQEMTKPLPITEARATAVETDLRAGQMATVTDSKCGLCVSAEKDAVFLPCKHVYACYGCACRVRDAADHLQRRCCLCRSTVESVTQLLLMYNVTYY